MTPEEEVKQLARKLGASLVGIASVAEINKYAPPGHRPDDILVGARSVIVFGGIHSLHGSFRSPDHRTHYRNRDFPRTSSGLAMALAKFIESNYGYYSVAAIPPSTGLNPSLSMKLCAEIAGLGTRSMAAGTILNPELGLPNFGICLTTMPLATDSRMEEDVCPHISCVRRWEKEGTTPCLEVCPECLSGELERGRIKWMRYDRRICSTRAQTEGSSPLLRTMIDGINEPDPEVRKTILLSSFYRRVMDANAVGAIFGECGECLRNCPICVQARTLNTKH